MTNDEKIELLQKVSQWGKSRGITNPNTQLNKCLEELGEEKWAPIKGYEGYYEVSTLGRVRALTRRIYAHDRLMNSCTEIRKERVLLPERSKLGYKRVTLSKNGKKERRPVHRLVAETFIPNPHNKPQVNHIDGNPSNNSVANLEWNTARENMRHSIEVLKSDRQTTRRRPVKCIESGEIFESVVEAQKKYGKNAHIGAAAAGKRKRAAKRHWEFIPKDRTPLYIKRARSDKDKKDIRSPVRCVETGKIFDSIKAASIWAGVAPCTIAHVLAGRASTAGQYHWEYSNERLDGNFIKNEKLDNQARAEEIIEYSRDRRRINEANI